MPTPRTPSPSRIGKTLGAILSNSRRGTNDVEIPEDATDIAEPPNKLRDDAPQPEPATPSPSIVSTPDLVTTDAPARGATMDPAPTRVEAPPAASIVAPDATASAGPADGAAFAGVSDAVDATRRKKRETFLIPEDLADAMRNAIVHLSGPPLYYTLAEFGEHAIRTYIAQLEREHNAGRPFPTRPRAVRQGRPLR